MEITFVFRTRIQGTYSIEGIFESISKEIPGSVKLYVPREGSSIRGIVKNILFCKERQTRVNHVTGDIHYVLLGMSSSNYNILTIHDCGILQDRDKPWWKRWAIKKLWFDWPVSKADIVTTVSAKSKQEIIQHTRCPSEKVVVIPNYVHPVYYPTTATRNKIPRLLHIGSTKNKNLGRVIEAVEGIPCELRIVGLLSKEHEDRLKATGIFYTNVHDLKLEEMRLEYEQADIVLFVSTYEGFGLPILEAQASGRPVITSNINPCREIAGEGAICVDPYSVHAIRHAIQYLLTDEHIYNKVIADGLINVERYSFKNVLAEYQHLYDTALLAIKTK